MHVEKKLTGYPSIDKPWLKYYPEEAIKAPLPECTIYEYIWLKNKDHLDDIALIFFGKKITYKKLFENIDRTANAFKAIGVKENDVVTLMMLNQPEMVYAFYALNKIGATTCVVNVLSSSKELVHYLSEGKSKYFIALDIFFDKAYEAAKEYGVKNLIYVPMYESLGMVKKAMYRMKIKKPKYEDTFVLSWSNFVKNASKDPIESAAYMDGKCTVIGHTGGTTGVPKGIMLTDKAINAILSQYSYKFIYSRQDTFLNMIVPFAVYGLVINLHLPLVVGVTVILIPKVDAATTDQLLQKHKPNHVASIPGYWNAIAESKEKYDWSWLKTAAAGGAGMTAELEQKLNAVFAEGGAKIHFMNGYGMSEVGSTACSQTHDCAEIGSVGIPLAQNVVAAFDTDTMEEKRYGELGEICILSPSMMLRYVENEEETNAVMKRHEDGNIWIHTGDIGYVNENGSVFIKGRIKRIYITQRNGAISKIFPDRIERTICTHPDVAECCAVCFSTDDDAYLPVAHIILHADCKLTEKNVEQQLIAICKKELPEYAHPVAYKFRKEFPLTAVGKIDYQALEKEAEKE